MRPDLIAPSLLAADFARLGEEAAAVLAAGADWLHLDVMDNHYVPNLTVGPLACRALREYGITAPIDVHLMCRPVDRLIAEFADAGASHITFHPEASDHVDRSLQLIRDCGAKGGLVLNPATGLQVLEYVMDKLDIVLVMSVNPGFGGQAFIPAMLEKIERARALIDDAGLDIRLAVDGGLNAENIGRVAAAGADTFIAGTAVFGRDDYRRALVELREAIARGRAEGA